LECRRMSEKDRFVHRFRYVEHAEPQNGQDENAFVQWFFLQPGTVIAIRWVIDLFTGR
jgi:hypothetical protein